MSPAARCAHANAVCDRDEKEEKKNARAKTAQTRAADCRRRVFSVPGKCVSAAERNPPTATAFHRVAYSRRGPPDATAANATRIVNPTYPTCLIRIVPDMSNSYRIRHVHNVAPPLFTAFKVPDQGAVKLF